jgi:PPP family 3-phenylpropionic acid transporter
MVVCMYVMCVIQYNLFGFFVALLFSLFRTESVTRSGWMREQEHDEHSGGLQHHHHHHHHHHQQQQQLVGEEEEEELGSIIELDEKKIILAKAKVLYFLIFGALGVGLPLLSVFYRDVGIHPLGVGWLATIPPLVSLFCTPFMCAVADATHLHKTFLVAGLILWAIAQSAVVMLSSFRQLSLDSLASSILRSPIISLIDAAVVSAAGSQSFGECRKWGAMGFGFASLASGLLEDSPLSWFGVYASFFILCIFATVLAVGFPMPSSIREEKAHPMIGLRVVCSDVKVLPVFAVITLSGMSSGIIDTFLFVRIAELGGSGLLMGLARLLMCLAEVPAFQISGFLLKRWGVLPVIGLAQAAYVVRFLYYSMITDSPWWVLPCEPLHGCTYALLWAAATAYASEIAPSGLVATLQGLVTGLHWGLGFALGAALAGALYNTVGAVRTFQAGAVVATISFTLVMSLLAQKSRQSHTQPEIDFELTAVSDLVSSQEEDELLLVAQERSGRPRARSRTRRDASNSPSAGL